jgi:N-carbamoyl-L-amino-acid hydrolase
MISLQQLNGAGEDSFVESLASIFEHSAWVPQRVAAARPFGSVIALHQALCNAVLEADVERQLALIRAHPELAGRLSVGELTAASSSEQAGAGLSTCTPQQYQRLQALNAEYHARFGFPFVLAVKGHTPDTVIATLQTRVQSAADEERSVALQEIFRIARFRLVDLVEEAIGEAIMSMAEDLAQFSESTDGLTCSYLTAAHRATAARILDYMLAAGLAAHIDAVGNVVGTLPGEYPARRLLTGSHYDTVINGGKYDGRLGILLPIAVAGALRRAGVRLPFALEIIAFAEEEGVRFNSTFLGSRAVVGRFGAELLDAVDARGVSMREALLGTDAAAINALKRDPAYVLGFVEVHIEQGPVLLEANLGVGVVTAIAGSARSLVSIEGLSGHAGTVPMALRQDAAAAAAEIVLAVESRCRSEPGLVGTVGQLQVPGGAINVIPGRCELSLDIRSGSDAVRTQAEADINAAIGEIAARRGVTVSRRRVLEVPSVPCAPTLQEALSESVWRVTRQPALRLPSGAGHDAMMMAHLTPVGMLFVRCGNGGISHHPQEHLQAADAALAAQVFEDFLISYKVSP